MQNWNKVGPVIVWDISDHTYECFDSLDLFINSRTFRHIADRIGDQSTLDKIAETRWATKHPFIFPKRYLVRDEQGLIIPLWKIEERQVNLGVPLTTKYIYWAPARNYKFRRGPVPHISCYRGGNSWFRSIKTYVDRRENDFCNEYDEDARFYGVRARAARTSGNLPEPWDDLGRSDWGHRTWKRHRKTQWKS